MELDPGYHDAILVATGDISVVGQKKTNMYPLAESLVVSGTSIVLPEDPLGWSEGDLVVVAGRRNFGEEVLQIQEIKGNSLHLVPASSQSEWVGFEEGELADRNTRNFVINLTANAEVTSEPEEMLN